MKVSSFIVFISVVLVIYSLISYYLFIRGYQALSSLPALKKPYIILFVFFSLTYIIARSCENFFPFQVSTFFHFTGSFWLGAIIYFLLFILALDLIRLINFVFPFYPKYIIVHYQEIKSYLFLIIICFTALILAAGNYNAKNPVIKKMNITINKKTEEISTLRMVCVSDIHLGWINGKKKFSKTVDSILAQKPDIILLVGDIIDEDIKPVIRQNIGDDLLRLSAPLGVFAVTGNHEFIGGINAASKYIIDHKIQLLRDSAVFIKNSFYLVGRNDKDASRFGGRGRKPLKEIVNDIDKSYPVILLDHQPFKLDSAIENGIDLQISGHTHHGQMWPGNILTNLIFEVSHGYLKKGNTHFYVSSGVGTWGPPVRIGNRPEIVVLDLNFINKN